MIVQYSPTNGFTHAISEKTLRRWYESLEGYHHADVPDTARTRNEIADLLDIHDPEVD